MSMISLQRHQLVHLRPEAWPLCLVNARDEVEREGLSHWAAHDLPLVVARQEAAAGAPTQKLGLPLPACWGRRRLALQVLPARVVRCAEFPAARDVAALLPAGARYALDRLCAELAACGVIPLAYGSYGWQCITGLDYVHERSDLDLLMHVADAAGADTAAALLSAFGSGLPRLDGELVFPHGEAAAWREWQAWRHAQRRGMDAAILVKRTHGVSLVNGRDTGCDRLGHACAPHRADRASAP